MPPNNITLTVVVNGVATPVTVNTHQTVEHLVNEAFKEAGYKQPKPDWELKDAQGNQIGLDQTIAAAGLTAGMTIYLGPPEGGGG
jgi:hypothetical protein